MPVPPPPPPAVFDAVFIEALVRSSMMRAVATSDWAETMRDATVSPSLLGADGETAWSEQAATAATMATAARRIGGRDTWTLQGAGGRECGPSARRAPQTGALMKKANAA